MELTKIPPNMFPYLVLGRIMLGPLSIAFMPFSAIFLTRDDQLSAFLHQMTTTHVRRWQKAHHREGEGHLYQGPFKSFPVESDEHLYTVCRHVERNPGVPGWCSGRKTGCGVAHGRGYISMIRGHCHYAISRYHDQTTGWIVSTGR